MLNSIHAKPLEEYMSLYNQYSSCSSILFDDARQDSGRRRHKSFREQLELVRTHNEVENIAPYDNGLTSSYSIASRQLVVSKGLPVIHGYAYVLLGRRERQALELQHIRPLLARTCLNYS
jgi:hypothetical protein